MTNWFQTNEIDPVYGWGPTKRWIVQGGPAVDACSSLHDAEQGFCELVERARKAGCVYVELRCFADYSPYRPALESAGFVYEPHFDVLIPTDRDPMGVLKDPKRRQLKQLLKSGCCWRESREEADLRSWYRCLSRLYREKVHRPVPRLCFFRRLLDEKGCHLLVTQGADGVVDGGMFLAVESDRSKAYEWYVCGSMLATWAGMEWCWQQGISVLDTMGAGCPGVAYGVRDFKLAMGGELHEYGRYRYILRPHVYALGAWWIRNQQSVRRWIGRWCPLSVLCSVLIGVLCLVPLSQAPRVLAFAGADKLVHGLMYLALSCCVLLESRSWKRALLWSAVWGGMIELLQAYCTAGARSGDWVDWLADLAGAFTGCLFLYLSNIYRFRR